MIKLTNLLKEIGVTPYGHFQNIQQLADYIDLHPKYKTELVNAVYDDAKLSKEWSDLRSNIINGETEIDGDILIMRSDDEDAILVSLKSKKTEIKGSIKLNGVTLYYGFL